VASGLFVILDDIALLMDDTAAMSKVAAKKNSRPTWRRFSG